MSAGTFPGPRRRPPSTKVVHAVPHYVWDMASVLQCIGFFMKTTEGPDQVLPFLEARLNEIGIDIQDTGGTLKVKSDCLNSQYQYQGRPLAWSPRLCRFVEEIARFLFIAERPRR